MKLNNSIIKSLKPKAKLYRKLDGQGLYLEVAKSGSKIWLHRYSFRGNPKLRVLGHYPDLSISEAREKLFEDKRLLRKGVNPIINSDNPNSRVKLSDQSTFEEVFEEWFEMKKDDWTHEYAKDVHERAVSYLFPDFGDKIIGQIKPKQLILSFKKMEKKGVLETLRRVKSIASRVFTYSIGMEYSEYNPARDIPMDLFKKPKKNHYAHITDPREFAQTLLKIKHADRDTNISYEVHLALSILPHLFLRVSELLELKWSEVDFENSLIRINPDRMKMRREHIVPLSSYVENQLKIIYEYTGKGTWVFPTPAIDKTGPISSNALLRTLRKLDIKKEDMTLHGFRHSASTMLNEMEFPSHVIEIQLSHSDKNSVRSTYNKATFLEQRRDMMECWSEYLLKLIKE